MKELLEELFIELPMTLINLMLAMTIGIPLMMIALVIEDVEESDRETDEQN